MIGFTIRSKILGFIETGDKTMIAQGMIRVTRRGLLLSGAALTLGSGLMPTRVLAAGAVKVAGIYTVPV